MKTRGRGVRGGVGGAVSAKTYSRKSLEDPWYRWEVGTTREVA